ncbi:MAG TPA: hypothetical protein VFZ53_31705 [Polyangiaceae bacterium]
MKRALFFVPCFALACSVGEGEGWVKSDNLYMEDCWNGQFDLGPTFFAANPSAGSKSLTIRVQNGDNIEEVSDGLVVVVNKLPTVRGQVGEALEVGLPPGVSPPGVPIVYEREPPNVSLALYLHESCHAQNSAIYSISGNITFEALYSGDPYEDDADELLTEARFTATFADPRQLVGTEVPENARSEVRGYFRFFYQRGQPAQPFQ